MKTTWLFVVLLAFAIPVAAADNGGGTPAGTGTDVKAPADAALAAIRARRAEVPPRGDVNVTSAFQRKQHDDVSHLAEKFLDAYPNDPRRMEVIAFAVTSPRLADMDDGDPDPAWIQRRDALRRELLATKDVPEATWVRVAETTVDDLCGFRSGRIRDTKWAGEIVALMASRVPDSSRRKFTEQVYLDALKKTDPAAAEPFLRTRVGPAEKNTAVAEMAAGELRIIEARRVPLELKFTAVDGREVDLAKLRGKVVLIDFWATWCGPCLKEMPAVRAAYQKFHDRGFEVIGISFDKAPSAPPRAMEKTAEQVNDFAQKNAMPWPHHYDGKYWENEFGRRFAIHEIPATFLIGPDGRIAATDVHGEALEPAISRLLKP
jgi:thiol-disulfide isomerase/thioredoxin